MTHEKRHDNSVYPVISPCPLPVWSLEASNGRETKENDGGDGMFTYKKENKKDEGRATTTRDDRISSIQIRQGGKMERKEIGKG